MNLLALQAPRSRRGITLTEILVALAISLIFMGSVVTAYVQIVRAANVAESRVQAHTRARAALDIMARDVEMVRSDPSIAPQEFRLVNNTLPYGDRIDHNGTGNPDDGEFNGFDDVGIWTPADDNHAQIGTRRERPDFVGLPDHGDFNIDNDVRFSRDELTIRIPADPLGSTPARRITYRIGTFEGLDYVLLREEENLQSGETLIDPLAFDVVSLDILAWNPNDDVVAPGGLMRPYWASEWDAADKTPPLNPIGAPPGTTPPFVFPAALMLSVVVNAEDMPLEEISGWPFGGRSLKTERLTTVVNIQEVVTSTIYQIYVRQPS